MSKAKELPIVIVMDGGLVQDVVSYDKKLIGRDVIVLDFDADGVDDCVADIDGGGEDCLPRREMIRKMSKHRYNAIKRLVKEREAE